MDFWAGWCGGVAGVVISHPVDVLRTRQAINSMSMRNTARALFRESKSLVGFYRGLCSPCLSVGLEKCVALGTYKWCLRDTPSPSTAEAVRASALAGVTAGLTIGPMEAIKVRTITQQAGARSSPGGFGLWSLLRMELGALSNLSVREAAKSTAFVCARDGLGTVGFLVPYECVKQAVQRAQPERAHSLLPAMVAGVVCGPIGWLSIYPLEVYRIHVFQATASTAKAQASERGIPAVIANIRQIHRRGGGGLRGLGVWFRGFAGVSLLSSLKMPVTMVVFEYLRCFEA